jgi:hypothetical protein
MMSKPFDMFRYDENDQPAWMQTGTSMIEARQYSWEHAAETPAKYLVFVQSAQTRIPVSSNEQQGIVST